MATGALLLTLAVAAAPGGALSAQAEPTPAKAQPAKAQEASGNVRQLTVPSVSSGGAVALAGTQAKVTAALSAPSTASFSMVGLTWSRQMGSQPVVQIRVHRPAGWTGWTTLSVADDGTGTPGTDPYFVDQSTGVEVRVAERPGSSLSDVRLSLINTPSTTEDHTLATTRANTSVASSIGTGVANYVPMPEIITRAQWGADESLRSRHPGCSKPVYSSTIEGAVVHHTAGSNNYTPAQSASIVRGIYAFHVVSRGWCDIAYNFLVDKYGQIFEGRFGGMTLPVKGAHATSWNDRTMGVSVMMDSNTATVSPAALSAVESVIAWKFAGYYRDPLSKVYLVNGTYNRIMRHGDVMSTDCPGKSITSMMPTIRSAVSGLMGNWKTPIYTAWQLQGGQAGTLGAPYQLESPIAGGRYTVFTNGVIFMDPAGNTFTMSRAIYSRYMALGGPAGALGWPTGSTVTTGTAQSVSFTTGSIFWSPAGGAYAVVPAVAAYLLAHPDQLAGVVGPRAPYLGTALSGSQEFVHGSVVWANGAVTVRISSGVFGDQDGDGRADLLTLSAATTRLSVRPITASLALGAPVSGDGPLPTTNWFSQVPDLNKDGFSDYIDRRNDGTLWLAYGYGPGRFRNYHRVGAGFASIRDLEVVPDMTGDGTPELLAVRADGGLLQYSITSAGTLVYQQALGGGFADIKVTGVGDLRGAGVSDVLALLPDGRLRDYYGTSTGKIMGNGYIPGDWSGLTRLWVIGDANGDGRPDLAGLTATGQVNLYLNTATGFQKVAQPLLSSLAGLAAVG